MRKSKRFLLILLAVLLSCGASAPALAAGPTVSALQGELCITELMGKNRTTLRDEDGDFSDWIELANLSDGVVSLKGFRIADREGRRGWLLPEKELKPGERLILFASKKNRNAPALHTDFALSEKDCVCLYDAAGLPVDSVACPDCDSDVSWALNDKGEWSESLYPTPGFENTADGYEAYQQTLTAAGPLIISEAQVKNIGLNVAGTSYDCDWVEIKNVSDMPVELSDYYLSDKDQSPFLWQLPIETLQPGGFAVFVCEASGTDSYGSTPCTGFSLNAAKDQLYLTSTAGGLIDRADLRDIPAGCSYGRMDGEAGFFYFAEPTPGTTNLDGRRRVSAMPACLTRDGVFEDTESVKVELAGEGILRYTINDSAPTEMSIAYNGPFEISETCVVSVRSYEPDALPSRVLTLSYIINEGHSLPVVSFVAEDFREFNAIYDAGVKLYELPGSLAMYRDGDSFRINCGVTLNGETSLVLPKKNMAVHINGAYGQATLEHDIFGGGATSFTALLLRAGQDQYQTVIRNELAQSLAEKANTAVVNQRSIFCVLYLNGEYAGLYTLKERPNASLYASVAGVDKDSVECFEAPAAYNSEFYMSTVDFVNKNDMRDPENYERFCQAVDIDSLIDWLFMEGFCANTDVTSGNLRYARSALADNKWHLLFYDLDAAFRSSSSVQCNLLNDYGASVIQVAAFSVPLMENESFREQFLTRAAELLRDPLSNEAVLAEIDRMADEIRPEIERDYKRAGSSVKSWENAMEELRYMIYDRDWRQLNIDGICQAFDLDDDAREKYFGDIDGRPRPED